MKRWVIMAVLLLCLTLSGASACSSVRGNQNTETGEEFAGQMVEVVRGDLMVSVSGIGLVDVSNEVNLSFDDGGEVSKIFVKEGDVVSEGELLAVLVPLHRETLELAVSQAELALATAEYNLDNARQIYTKPDIAKAWQAFYDARDYLDYAKDRLETANIYKEVWANEVYHAELDLARAQQELDRILAGGDAKEVVLREQEVATAEQALEEAQDALEEEIITAPFDGIVTSVYVDEGDVVPDPSMSQVTIIHLIDPTIMELSVELDEIDVPGVELGQRAVISVYALPDEQLAGVVTLVSSVPTREAGLVQYKVKIALNVPEDSRLKAGMSATADIVTDERSSVLLVPNRAIRQDSQGNPVVKVMVNDQIEERAVVTGISDGSQTEIVSGLNEGDMVVDGFLEYANE
jgi:HlyD family secretion protein